MKKKEQNNLPRESIFLSHAGADNQKASGKRGAGPVEMFEKILEVKYKDRIFCSSVSQKGIKAGEYLHEQINKNIKKCSLFLAIITDNYVRSPHCLYELCAARFSGKAVVAIYSNEQVQQNLKHIADQEWRSIDLKGNINVSHQNVVDLWSALDLSYDKDKRKNIILESKLQKFLSKIASTKATERPYVGMSESVYKNLLRYCEQESIVKFGDGAVYTQKEMIERCRKAKKIYLISTTGAGLLKTLKEDALKKALWNKAEIKIIIPDRNSLFCKDVAEAECCRDGYNVIIENQNKRRIESEFEATIQYLNETYCLAQKRHKNIGKIIVYSSRTLLRQTLFLTISQENSSWGWINMTMPPLRTAETPSIAISDTNAQKGLDKFIINHCECLIKMARKRNAYRIIDGKTIASPLETTRKKELLKYWEKKTDAAKKLMQERNKYDKILIEIAAQHPLINGEFPNNEFQKRLDTAIQLSMELGREKVWFYCPGSRHKYNGIEDKISLSRAGKNYLIEHEIERSHIYSDETNVKYKGELGVYNSADESYVASRIFNEDNFGRIICVCSPYQTLRKSFYYLEFGLIPECYGVPCNDMYHNPVSEYFGSLSHTVIEDHNWQCEESEAAQKSRIERKI